MSIDIQELYGNFLITEIIEHTGSWILKAEGPKSHEAPVMEKDALKRIAQLQWTTLDLSKVKLACFVGLLSSIPAQNQLFWYLWAENTVWMLFFILKVVFASIVPCQ